jgi:hypothetical protein
MPTAPHETTANAAASTSNTTGILKKVFGN